jgi:hypothetical protein
MSSFRRVADETAGHSVAGQQADAAKLDAVIAANLKELGYGGGLWPTATVLDLAGGGG